MGFCGNKFQFFKVESYSDKKAFNELISIMVNDLLSIITCITLNESQTAIYKLLFIIYFFNFPNLYEY